MTSAAEIRTKYDKKEKDDGQTGVLRRTRCRLSFLPLMRITAVCGIPPLFAGDHLLIYVGVVGHSRVRKASIETISD